MKLRAPIVHCVCFSALACGTASVDVLDGTDAGTTTTEPTVRDGGSDPSDGPIPVSGEPFSACPGPDDPVVVRHDGVVEGSVVHLAAHSIDFGLLVQENPPGHFSERRPVVYRYARDGAHQVRAELDESEVARLYGVFPDIVFGAGADGTEAHTDYEVITEQVVAQGGILLRLTRNLMGGTAHDVTVFTATTSHHVTSALRIQNRVMYTVSSFGRVRIHSRNLNNNQVTSSILPARSGDAELVASDTAVHAVRMGQYSDERRMLVDSFDRMASPVGVAVDYEHCFSPSFDAVIADGVMATVVDCDAGPVLALRRLDEPTPYAAVEVTSGRIRAPSQIAWDGQVFLVMTWIEGEAAARVRDVRPTGEIIGVLARLPADQSVGHSTALAVAVDRNRRRVGAAYAGVGTTATFVRFDSCRQ